MPEHDNTTALPDPNLIGDEPKQSSSLPESDDQSVELAAEDTVSPSANTTEVSAPKDVEAPAQTESRQGSGAVPITWGGMWSQFEDTPHFEIPIRGH